MRSAAKKKKMGRKYKILMVLASNIIVLDQITKYLIVEKFRLGESYQVISNFFNLTYVQNKGAAFGLLAQADPSFRIPFFVIIPFIALAQSPTYFVSYPRLTSSLLAHFL
jgi:signal peptidase II